MKKIASILALFMLSISLCVCSISFVGCSKNNFNLANTVIENFSDFESIGVGVEANTVRGFVASAEPAENSKGKPHLIGKKKNGAYEKIKFVDHKNKEVEQTYVLNDILIFGRFVFVGYSEGPGSNLSQNMQDETIFFNQQTFVIDSKTGKVYSVEKLCELGMFTLNVYRYAGKRNIVVTEDEIYFVDIQSYYGGTDKIYKLSFSGDLVVEKILDGKDLLFDSHKLDMDRFGNLYLFKQNESNPCYVISKNKQIAMLDGIFDKALNQVYYAKDKTKKVDENGAVVANTDSVVLVFDEYNYTNADLVLTSGNKSYYHCYLDNTTQKQSNIIVEIEWINDIEFVATITDVSSLVPLVSNIATANGKVYFLDTDTITYIDVETLQVKDIVSNYLFRKIETNAFGEVEFSAMNSNMNIISGIIKADNSVEVSIAENGYEILYIAPLA